MSVSAHRVSLFRAKDVLVFTAILISGACYQAQSAAPRAGVVEPSRQLIQSTEERRSRRFAGIDVVPTGHSAFAIRINSGMVGNGEPLYVIDGAPMMIPSRRGIDWFKPEDIAQIKVLKYPYELAEYGPEGVNGVVVITTKQGVGRLRRR